MRITVFCGAGTGARPRYAQRARTFGAELAQAGVEIVFGGGRVGQMGALADGALAAGGTVIGVIPRSLQDAEIAHDGLTELHVTETMHERKALMVALGDAFVALPGGAGTLDELFEAWTWQQLGLHAKPVGLLDVEGYWGPLLAALDAMAAEQFIRAADRDTLIVATSTAQYLDAVRTFTPAASKLAR